MSPAEKDFHESEAEKLALKEFESVGDEGLFPNHTDKDIWVNGFKSCYILLMANVINP